MEAKIFNYKCWVRGGGQDLAPLLGEWLHRSEFRVLGHCEHQFSPEGFTKLWLLAESHLALHTFPEADSNYVELSSCNLQKLECFVTLLRDSGLHISNAANDTCEALVAQANNECF